MPVEAACNVFVDCLKAEDELKACAHVLAGSSYLVESHRPAIIYFHYAKKTLADFLSSADGPWGPVSGDSFPVCGEGRQLLASVLAL